MGLPGCLFVCLLILLLVFFFYLIMPHLKSFDLSVAPNYAAV